MPDAVSTDYLSGAAAMLRERPRSDRLGLGLGPVQPPRHHRGTAPGSVCPVVGNPFLARAEAVEWENPTRTAHADVPHYYHAAMTASLDGGHPQITPDGVVLGGSWLGPAPDCAMAKDNDRAPWRPRKDSTGLGLGVALLALLGLAVAACIVTDNGGF